jgi:hypothetical protein
VCTSTWLIHADGYELFFNRDESVRRGVALPPERLELGGMRVLAPRDADAGGTWIGVNERGLAVGLLNGADRRGGSAAAGDTRSDDGTERRSRGLLVAELLAARTPDEALAALADGALARYRGFLVAVFAPGAAPAALRWDGAELTTVPARAPLASSSLDGGRAALERARVYAATVGDAPERAALAAFQRSHAPARGPWSPCMHREDAATVSATEVRVDARTVALRYAPGPPCTTPFGPWLELERR